MLATTKARPAARLLRILAETHDITSFSPQEFHADGNKVFVAGHYTWVMKPSGVKGGWTVPHLDDPQRQGRLVRSLNDTALLAEAGGG